MLHQLLALCSRAAGFAVPGGHKVQFCEVLEVVARHHAIILGLAAFRRIERFQY